MFLNLQAEVIFSCHLNFVNIYIYLIPLAFSNYTCLRHTKQKESYLFLLSYFCFFFFFLNKLESDYFGLNPNYI